MSEAEKVKTVEKRKKKKKRGKPCEKKKVLKIGGLWIDSVSFPEFNDEKDADLPPRQ